jgi:hypothetical protein
MQLFLHRADDCAPGSRSSLPFAIRKTARIIGHSELLQYMTRSVQIEILLMDDFSDKFLPKFLGRFVQLRSGRSSM